MFRLYWPDQTPPSPTAREKELLAQLTPQVRAQVEARLTGGDTVRGILETMLLNNLSQLFASNRVLAIDYDRSVVTVEGQDGTTRTFPFDIATLVIKG